MTTVKREMNVGSSGVQDYNENPKPGMMSFTVRDAGNMTVASFMNSGLATVVMHLASGKTISGQNMICTECSPVKATDATFDVKYEGKQVTES